MPVIQLGGERRPLLAWGKKWDLVPASLSNQELGLDPGWPSGEDVWHGMDEGSRRTEEAQLVHGALDFRIKGDGLVRQPPHAGLVPPGRLWERTGSGKIRGKTFVCLLTRTQNWVLIAAFWAFLWESRKITCLVCERVGGHNAPKTNSVLHFISLTQNLVQNLALMGRQINPLSPKSHAGSKLRGGLNGRPGGGAESLVVV